MNKVLILDDRIERKRTHLSDNSIKELDHCISQGLLKMITGENLEKDFTFQFCDEYSMLAIHKSWLVSYKLVRSIEEYAERNQKYLIIFSGGIDQTILLNDYKYLSVNSALFYTEKLPKFIETYAKSDDIEFPLLQLLYGKNWRLPIYMKYREIVWKGLKEDDDEYDIFKVNYEQLINQFNASTSIEILSLLDNTIKKEIIKSNAL